MRNILLIATLIIWAGIVFAQNQDVQLGSGTIQQLRNNPGALYDYSDPQSVNIKVAIWGFVKFPGRYIVPVNTKASDLLSLAGGPVAEARVNEFRLVRTNPDSSQTVINLDFSDFLYSSDVSKINNTLTLKAGDILLATGGPPRMFFRDYFSIGISIVSLLLSVIILIRQG
jgi:hypothetical protein